MRWSKYKPYANPMETSVWRRYGPLLMAGCMEADSRSQSMLNIDTVRGDVPSFLRVVSNDFYAELLLAKKTFAIVARVNTPSDVREIKTAEDLIASFRWLADEIEKEVQGE